MTIKKTFWQKYEAWIWALVFVLIYIWAFSGIPATGIQAVAGEVTKSILNGMLHPDFSYVYTGDGEDLVSLLLQTLAIAFAGTLASAIFSIPFAFWAARMKKGGIHFTSSTGKLFLTIVRTFPEIVMAIMFIKAVGPGPFAGVLAVSFHSIGMLGKLFAEAVEEIDRRPAEAIIAAGGTHFDVLIHATIPAVIPEFISLTLYRFEIAVRSASILGLVGAGGIGAPLIFAIGTRWWPRVAIILLGIIVMVTVIDFLSGYLRKKLV
ncbi:phosphonate ABC transporter, permease protein PhnE [Periweissella fabalis]|uniref:Phosphonate ABC transporter, permease protein PhnE n=1 Tax=Periweissella fabalis TaxID=1070421 RepID=A0A7X6N227_9LACO|nr:phosphonate ABC transporter, permease protein PhnE [Periweissella fabalis]MCM0599524.1 phosphonate ABC transporter, permease protein PhnE [Periweissella fabalis]NKZ23829.1 phosphonate ABC transporter, permease protein PhnE [Periweissella fabalis]